MASIGDVPRAVSEHEVKEAISYAKAHGADRSAQIIEFLWCEVTMHRIERELNQQTIADLRAAGMAAE